MAEKISWKEPGDTTVTQVEISRSSTLYGTYSVIATIYSTDDAAAKSSSNSWVTTYTDSGGIRTDWYKIRFYDGTYYSSYSDPITSEELTRLCSVADVKKNIDTTGRWTDSEVFDAITVEDELIYLDAGTPIQGVWSEIGKIDSTVQTRYYVGEEDIYRVDRVFYGTTTKTELFLDDGYRMNPIRGMVEILPVGSSGVTPDVTCDIEVHYVPKIFHKLCVYKTCKNLLEQQDMLSSGSTSKEVSVINDRIKDIETIIQNRYCLQISSQVKYYDKRYGVNRTHINQDSDRNKYLGEYGW